MDNPIKVGTRIKVKSGWYYKFHTIPAPSKKGPNIVEENDREATVIEIDIKADFVKLRHTRSARISEQSISLYDGDWKLQFGIGDGEEDASIISWDAPQTLPDNFKFSRLDLIND